MDQLVVAQTVVVDQIWWYSSRAAGIVAWVLISLSLFTGMSMSTTGQAHLPAGWLLDLHRFISTLAIVFLTAHMVLLIPDTFVEFGIVELLVPMTSTWNPEAVSWGVVGFWLLVAVELTSLAKSRLSRRVWKTVHLFSFPAWIVATVHLFEAGTDVSHPLFRVLQAVIITAIVVRFITRISRRRKSRSVSPESGVSGGSLPVEEAVNIDQVDPWKGREFSA